MTRIGEPDIREHAHQLLDQLDNARLAAVVHLLGVMVRGNEEDEEISAEEEAAVARSKEWFRTNAGTPFDQVATELGFTIEQIAGTAVEEPSP